MPAVDLTSIPVVDNHCHGLYAAQTASDAQAWRGHFTESRMPRMREVFAGQSLFYQRLMRELAAFFGCATRGGGGACGAWGTGGGRAD